MPIHIEMLSLIIMNKLQESTFFGGLKKLITALKLRPEK